MTNPFNPVVTTSGTFQFSPSGGEIILNAFDRVGIRATAIEPTQMQRAIMELNLAFVKLNNLGPNLWTVDLQSVPLVQGTATYSVPAETTMILDAYIRYSNSPQLDRYMYPISRTDYASISTKTTQAPPSQFWFDRISSPTVTLYPVPDGAFPYVFYFWRYRQIQDATIANGQNTDIVYRFLDATISDLAHRLARIYRPDIEAARKADRDEAWSIAATQDTEFVPMHISPGLGGYYR